MTRIEAIGACFDACRHIPDGGGVNALNALPRVSHKCSSSTLKGRLRRIIQNKKSLLHISEENRRSCSLHARLTLLCFDRRSAGARECAKACHANEHLVHGVQDCVIFFLKKM